MHALTSPRAPLRALFMTASLLLFASLSACTYESSSLAGLICEEEGKREGDRVCQAGVWVVQAGQDLPESDLPIIDLPDPIDMPDLADDMPDQPCEPEPDVLFCLRQSASCGSLTALDNCGVERAVAECGPCTGAGESCQGNRCEACVPEADAAFCARLGKGCGQVSGADNCGIARENIGCGTCSGSDTCADNVCVCVPESDVAYCGRLAKQCGIVAQGTDNCGMPRVDVDCGGCAQGMCRADNTCSVCQPEQQPAFCARNGATCGDKTAPDNCGVMRTEQCGTCGAGESCTGNQCVCPAPACPGNAQCGTVSNACGRPSPSCGTCSMGAQCNGSNQCICPTPVCPANAQCGTATNMCGGMTSCGPLNGMCPAGSTCTGNACICTPETPAAFCARNGATCGGKTAPDNCGVMRTEQCGPCGTGQMCGAANTCVCAPETDTQFCARLGAECGSRTAPDNCGMSRTVTTCGTCVGGLPVCTLNQCVASCAAETDTQFCARLGAECGSRTAPDNCGMSRTVMECGTCTNDETCTANQCECPAAVCGAAVCGSVTNACGNMTMCGNMGACATGGQICDPSARTCSNIVLTAPTPNGGDILGWSLVLRGDLLIVGKPDADVGGQIDKGEVDVWRRNTTTNQWAHAQTLSPNDHTDMALRGAANDYFGTSVAFDGTTLVVGAPQYNIGTPGNTGKGYVYTYTLSGNTFGFQQRLAPSGGGGNVNVSDNSRYGWSVAVSGARLLVGAPYDAGGGSAVVWARTNAGAWEGQRRLRLDMNSGSRAEGDEFGFAVALAGNIALVGAPGRGPNNTGAVGVFEQTNTSNNDWTRRHTFNGGFAEGERLGSAVAVEGTRGVLGAPGSNKVYVVEGLLSSRSTITIPYTQSAAGDRFGAAVSLAGSRLLVGAPGHTSSQGRAFMFGFANGMWAQTAAVTAPAGQSSNDDLFGHAVCVDGTRAAVSAPERTASGQSDGGVVFVYEYP